MISTQISQDRVALDLQPVILVLLGATAGNVHRAEQLAYLKSNSGVCDS
jgi:hypothetical protein